MPTLLYMQLSNVALCATGSAVHTLLVAHANILVHERTIGIVVHSSASAHTGSVVQTCCEAHAKRLVRARALLALWCAQALWCAEALRGTVVGVEMGLVVGAVVGVVAVGAFVGAATEVEAMDAAKVVFGTVVSLFSRRGCSLGRSMGCRRDTSAGVSYELW